MWMSFLIRTDVSRFEIPDEAQMSFPLQQSVCVEIQASR